MKFVASPIPVSRSNHRSRSTAFLFPTFLRTARIREKGFLKMVRVFRVVCGLVRSP